ncbi:Cytochrome b5 type B [Toxocara canis]|uniref:Cytochrome b5 type B n=1 Tax=Toxocara canis TaxID=6265 RepID=A0A0B2VJ39_TOXCA|nr:Cytochrome b5 type B [Toxocara canis]KHN81399.1 Cytochrome b5 type B [Toxocara canis]
MGYNEAEEGNGEINIEEVAKHNTAASIWMIYEDKVLDITNFLDKHPGGDSILLEVAGQDGTSRFRDIRHSKDAVKMIDQYVIGIVKKDADTQKKNSFDTKVTRLDKNTKSLTAVRASIKVINGQSGMRAKRPAQDVRFDDSPITSIGFANHPEITEIQILLDLTAR